MSDRCRRGIDDQSRERRRRIGRIAITETSTTVTNPRPADPRKGPAAERGGAREAAARASRGPNADAGAQVRRPAGRRGSVGWAVAARTRIVPGIRNTRTLITISAAPRNAPAASETASARNEPARAVAMGRRRAAQLSSRRARPPQRRARWTTPCSNSCGRPYARGRHERSRPSATTDRTARGAHPPEAPRGRPHAHGRCSTSSLQLSTPNRERTEPDRRRAASASGPSRSTRSSSSSSRPTPDRRRAPGGPAFVVQRGGRCHRAVLEVAGVMEWVRSAGAPSLVRVLSARVRACRAAASARDRRGSSARSW